MKTKEPINVLEFSPSRLSMFEDCMWQGYLRYIKRIPTKPSYPAEMGKAPHLAISLIINQGLDPKLAVKQAMAKAQLPLSYDKVMAHVENMIKYYESIKSEYNLVAENEFKTPLSEDDNDPFALPLKGYKDLKDSEKGFVLDWKTGKEQDSKDNFALALYAWHEAKITGKKSIIGRLVFTAHDNKVSEHKFTSKTMKKAFDRAIQIAEKVQSAVLQLNFGGKPEDLFPCTKNDKCQYCNYPELCLIKQEKKEIKEIEKVTDHDMAIKTSGRIDELEAEIKRLKALLKGYVDDTGIDLEAGDKVWCYRTSSSWKLPEENPLVAKAEIAKAIISKGDNPLEYFELDFKKNLLFTEEELKQFGCIKGTSKAFRSIKAEIYKKELEKAQKQEKAG